VGGRKKLSETQGPEDLQNRSQPRPQPSRGIGLIATRQPVNHADERLAQKCSCRLRVVQAARPAAESGGIGQPIGIFESGRRIFPGAVIHKVSPERLTASQQAVVRVRERKQRKESEGLSATVAEAAPDSNPVVMFIVCLLAAVPVADDRIALTNGASSQDDFGAGSRPIGLELVRRGGKWDKKNRRSWGLCPGG